MECQEAFEWTEERIARLRELWDLGHTASEIAHELGNGSRSAVLGKAYRLGLPKRSEEAKARAITRGMASKSIRLVARHGRIVEPLNITFADLGPNMCRFPTDDAAQFYCGRPQEHGTSYCDDCCRVAFLNYEQIVNARPAPLRTPQNGRVAAPFTMPVMGGLVRRVPLQ